MKLLDYKFKHSSHQVCGGLRSEKKIPIENFWKNKQTSQFGDKYWIKIVRNKLDSLKQLENWWYIRTDNLQYGNAIMLPNEQYENGK